VTKISMMLFMFLRCMSSIDVHVLSRVMYETSALQEGGEGSRW